MGVKMQKKINAVILGHAIGDALGVPVEFYLREDLSVNPVTDMRGYGRYYVPAGTWSDDTSMSLCAMESLSKGIVDFDDIMEYFWQWYYEDDFTATDITFDVGVSCAEAIENYYEKGKSVFDCGCKEVSQNGNGSLMRITPFSLFTYYNDNLPIEKKIDIIHKASGLTHAHKRSLIGCGIYSFILWELLNKPSKKSIFQGIVNAQVFYKNENEFKHYNRLIDKEFGERNIYDIKSSGYIVETLEAAVWCLYTTDSFENCLLKAVNLGGDTDTIGAVVGGLAGALYGYQAIPDKWLNVLQKKDYIEKMCVTFYNGLIKNQEANKWK